MQIVDVSKDSWLPLIPNVGDIHNLTESTLHKITWSPVSRYIQCVPIAVVTPHSLR